jgi:transposase
MEVMHDRVAGLDVHKKTVVACVRVMKGRKASRECRKFDTTTAGLQALLAWLTECEVTHVAMEATGVYWKPVWNILSDGSFEMILANAAHIKNVPGRKTDMNDAMWIADLVACGLIRGSFIPEEQLQELRSLMRNRKQLVREQVKRTQRIQKSFEEANIKIDSVISDVLGVSGRRILEAIVAGEQDPDKLAALAHKRIKASRAALREALRGRVTDHHRFMLQHNVEQYDTITSWIKQLDRRVNELIAGMDALIPKTAIPKAAAHKKAAKAKRKKASAGTDRHATVFWLLIESLCTVPGLDVMSAIMILAEIGFDMSRFPTSGHLVAWAGLCPGQNESAGKHKSSRMRKGAPWLKTVLVQCAWAATRKKDSYYKAQFNRLKGKRGPKKAICAVAASLLTAIYHMLKNGTTHQDLGADHFNRRSNEDKANYLAKQIAKLGFQVELKPLPEVPDALAKQPTTRRAETPQAA